MDRLFTTHRVRLCREAAPLWTLRTPDEGGLDTPAQALVPGVWETLPRLRSYRGRGIFEQTLTCGGNVRFLFGGVSFRARVLLDGQELCRHYGAYTAFDAIAENLPMGQHTLTVEADNRFGEDSALHIPNDYYSYGGITRPVLVEQLGDAYITRIHVTPARTPEGWQAQTAVTVQNLSSQPAAYELRIAVAGLAETVLPVQLPARETAVFTAVLACPDAVAWQPLAAKLYTVSAVLEKDGVPVDDLCDRFGFRQVTVEGRSILVNGEKVYLKGFNRHEDWGAFGCAVPLSAMQQDLAMMLDLGCNCVRTCHYPNDPLFLDLCDELGILVWEESHARGLSEERMRNPHFMEQSILCTEEMVRQHYNHPSIFIWGCLNECADDTEYGADCYRQLYALLHRLDQSRPVTAALLERPGGRVYDAQDVVSINIYPQWYHMRPVDWQIAAKREEIAAGGGGEKPLIISEIGAGAIYGFHDPLSRCKWTEERQCDILRGQIEAVFAEEAVCGIFLWQFADCRVTEEEWFDKRPLCCNNKGVVDEYRRPKMSYAVVKELFTGKA
jgi:beta-glucuronidase